jgi:hypothetical protein
LKSNIISNSAGNIEGAEMELDLTSVATIVQEAGRIAVRDEMDARDRYNPWETSEAWLRITMAQRLRRICRLPGSPRYRVHDEYPEKKITNMRSTHPIDIVVLHPLPDGKNPWAYCPPLGIIEIKRNFQNLEEEWEPPKSNDAIARF